MAEGGGSQGNLSDSAIRSAGNAAADNMPTATADELLRAVTDYEANLRNAADHLRNQDGSTILTDAHIRAAVKKLGHSKRVSIQRKIGAYALNLVGATVLGLAGGLLLAGDGDPVNTVFIAILAFCLALAGAYVREHE